MDKKRKLLSNIQIGGPGLSMSEIRTLAQNEPEAFARVVQEEVDKGEFGLADIRDIRSLYQHLADLPVKVAMPDAVGTVRALTTSAFPVLIGATVVKAVNDAYEEYPSIGEQLVTELDADEAVTTIAAIRSNDKKADAVKEGEDYPEIGASDENFEIGEKRNGRILRITAEAISRNQIGDIVRRVNALGRIAATFVEKRTLQMVTDVWGSAATPAAPYVLRPNGSGASLFSATANTPTIRTPLGTRYETNVLADETDIGNVRLRMAGNKDDLGEPLVIDPNQCILLAPVALEDVAHKIKNTESIISASGSFAKNVYGPGGKYAGWQPLFSEHLDGMATHAWYFGMPKRQFVRKWALRYELVTLAENTESYLRARIAFQARLAWNCEIGATDSVFWMQSLAGTTPPTAPSV